MKKTVATSTLQRVIKGVLILALALFCITVPCFGSETAEAATHISTPGSSPSQPSQDSGAATQRGYVVVPDEDEDPGNSENDIGTVLMIVIVALIVIGCGWYMLKIVGTVLLVIAEVLLAAVGWISRFLSFDD